MYPDEEYDQPGIYALHAYDATRALLYRSNITNEFQIFSAADFISSTEEKFFVKKIAHAEVVEIVSIIGKTCHNGYWTKGLGFSGSIDDKAFYSNSIDVLKDILWPAQPWHTERRRRFLAGTSGTIRVGVPAKSLFRQFVKVETHPKTNVVSYDGFSIKVFEEAMRIAYVDTDLTFNYTPFEGEYDDLVEQIALGVRLLKLRY